MTQLATNTISSVVSTDYSVHVMRYSYKGGVNVTVACKERTSVLNAAKFAQEALSYFQFEVRNLPEGEYYEIEISNRIGALELYVLER